MGPTRTKQSVQETQITTVVPMNHGEKMVMAGEGMAFREK